MSRERKTIDTFRIEINYGQGWECDCIEFTRTAARNQIEAYANNCPEYPRRIVSRREPKTAYDAFQLAEIEALKQRERDERHAKRMARLAARHSRGA